MWSPKFSKTKLFVLPEKSFGKRDSECYTSGSEAFGNIKSTSCQPVISHQAETLTNQNFHCLCHVQCSTLINSKSKKNSRPINYWRCKRKIGIQFLLNDRISVHDPRPYIRIKIESKYFTGLLDSGATDSFLGKNSLQFMQ